MPAPPVPKKLSASCLVAVALLLHPDLGRAASGKVADAEALARALAKLPPGAEMVVRPLGDGSFQVSRPAASKGGSAAKTTPAAAAAAPSKAGAAAVSAEAAPAKPARTAADVRKDITELLKKDFATGFDLRGRGASALSGLSGR